MNALQDRFLRIHGSHAFARRFARGLGMAEFHVSSCGACGAACTLDVPFVFAMGKRFAGMRGLTAATCTCGNERMPFCVPFETPKRAAKKVRWRRRRPKVIPLRRPA